LKNFLYERIAHLFLPVIFVVLPFCFCLVVFVYALQDSINVR